MDYEALKTLIEQHPNYASATDEELAAWCNQEVISRDKTSLPNEQILSTILANRAEFAALADGDKQLVRDILYVGDSVPTEAGAPARDTLVALFGAGSATIQTLAAAMRYQISRAASVGIVAEIRPGDVRHARSI